MARTQFAPRVIVETLPGVSDFPLHLTRRLQVRYRRIPRSRETLQRRVRKGLVEPLIDTELATQFPSWIAQARVEWPAWLRRARARPGWKPPADRPMPPFPNLQNFFRVAVPKNQSPEQWAETIRQMDLPGIARVFADPKLGPAESRGYSCDERPQKHRRAFQDGGLGLDLVQLDDPFLNSRGEGQHFVDIETGWYLEHEQLKAYTANNPLCGLSEIAIRHGTAVVGIVCGRAPEGRSSGIAPEVAGVALASYRFPITFEEASARRWLEYFEDQLAGNTEITEPTDLQVDQDTGDTFTHNLWKTLASSINYFQDRKSERGVILLEVIAYIIIGNEEVQLPVEVIPCLRGILLLANLLNITVVEAAGNDKYKMDVYPGESSSYPLRRGTSYEFDSGAVVVGGIFDRSNTGSRIDCLAHGRGIVAPDSESTTDCRGDFGSTSGASAIIAGAALVLQSIHFAYKQSHLTPDEVRVCLDSRKWSDAEPDALPTMPDLNAILRTHLQLMP